MNKITFTKHQDNHCNKLLLFDLDGTLVNTDNIYIKVWNELLKEYNLKCDKTFFNYFIKGKSDITFMKYLYKDITNDCIKDISQKKNDLFIKLLNKNKNILFDGVLSFLKRINIIILLLLQVVIKKQPSIF